MLKAPLFFILFHVLVCGAVAQDTISVMYYNLLKFPDEIPGRITDLRKIIGYTQPDIFVVNELTDESGAVAILNEALNVFGADHYSAAEYVDGTDTDNMLFYNNEKLGLIDQVQIPTGLRDISGYKLYYKHPELGSSSDTIFLNVFGMHLKAGSGSFDQRKDEALVLKYYLNDMDIPENIIAGGDFNFYSGNEPGCQAMLDGADVYLFDPIDQIGNWSNNSFYADIHTQSTRTSSFGTGAGGGMDDRFDLIFLSEDALYNEHGLTFLEGSYQALGQDGDRFNESIVIPFNPSVPDSISEALYYMSDHLPLSLSLVTDYTASVNNASIETKLKLYYNTVENAIILNQTIPSGSLQIYNATGSLFGTYSVDNNQRIRLNERLAPGIYFCAGRLCKEQIGFSFLVPD